MHDKTVTQLAAALDSGELSCRELTSHFFTAHRENRRPAE